MFLIDHQVAFDDAGLDRDAERGGQSGQRAPVHRLDAVAALRNDLTTGEPREYHVGRHQQRHGLGIAEIGRIDKPLDDCCRHRVAGR